ncbi:dehydrogenase [Pseudomonas aeruginosa]|uniref:SagB family peptide dehydrogenase n=1 Tax=Pseudomonas aeruginosa TaxID=287 RepID=UPI000F51F1FB|nr:SagB family peptide dehydrogenase [Pseudomonas aeruginosa]MCO2075355.1 SagB/ThcOx family dehydrogenase [Pseudomonas aeruginosa]RQF50337.1 dehydrogenase [Pseudomonas aeruginosa]
MHINKNFFMLATPPHLIVWDYRNHAQYELDESYAIRLMELISDPSLFDMSNEIDREFSEAGLLLDEPQEPVNWGWDELSRIFHVGTQNLLLEYMPEDIDEWSSQYLRHCEEILDRPLPKARFTDNSTQGLVHLPPPALDDMGIALNCTLLGRKTSRDFSGKGVSLADLSTLLYLSLGYLKEREADIDELVPKTLRARRSSPSGGGMNACEGYVYAARVDDLEPGCYFYHADIHALRFLRPLPEEPLGLLLAGQHFANRLPLGLFLTSRFDKLWWKYEHSRTYRMAYVEAGHISQTFQLVATALGMGTWLTGAFADEAVERLLELEGSAEQPLFFVASGYGSGETHCQALATLVEDDGEK